jgi:hypothetical protein
MARYLVDWNRKGSLPTLRRLMQRCCEVFAAGAHRHFKEELARSIAQFTVQRARGGDKDALKEYAAWVRGLAPTQAGTNTRYVFEPLWCYPRHRAIREAAEWLFNDKSSPWYLIIDPEQKRGGLGYHNKRLFGTPLIEVPAFRAQLLRALGDKRDGGQFTVKNSGRISITVTSGWTTGGSAEDRNTLPAGTTGTFRVCDVYAREICRAHAEAPKICLHWPEPKRDKAVAACKAFIKAYRVDKDG